MLNNIAYPLMAGPIGIMDVASFLVLMVVILALVYVMVNVVGSLIEIGLYGVAGLALVGVLFLLIDSLDLNGAVAVGAQVVDFVVKLLLG